MSVMTNEEITAEFENLFATENPDEEKPEEPEDQTSEEETPEETAEDNNDSEQAEDESKDESDSQKETQPAEDKQQSRQNKAFAEQRIQIKEQSQQIKKQTNFIKNIGKLIGYEGDSLDEIQDKVAEALLAKQAKEQNIPVDILKRLEKAESLIQENDQIKLEKRITENFTDLIEEHNLTKEQLDEFTKYLIDNGKNPMLDPSVDLQAEYLKLHFKDMIAAAVQDAVAKEQNRQKKVEDQSPSAAPKSPASKDDAKISTVKELDDLFANTDL